MKNVRNLRFDERRLGTDRPAETLRRSISADIRLRSQCDRTGMWQDWVTGLSTEPWEGGPGGAAGLVTGRTFRVGLNTSHRCRNYLIVCWGQGSWDRFLGNLTDMTISNAKFSELTQNIQQIEYNNLLLFRSELLLWQRKDQDKYYRRPELPIYTLVPSITRPTHTHHLSSAAVRLRWCHSGWIHRRTVEVLLIFLTMERTARYELLYPNSVGLPAVPIPVWEEVDSARPLPQDLKIYPTDLKRFKLGPICLTLNSISKCRGRSIKYPWLTSAMFRVIQVQRTSIRSRDWDGLCIAFSGLELPNLVDTNHTDLWDVNWHVSSTPEREIGHNQW